MLWKGRPISHLFKGRLGELRKWGQSALRHCAALMSAECADPMSLDDIEDLMGLGDDAPQGRLEEREILGERRSRERRRQRKEKALKKAEEADERDRLVKQEEEGEEEAKTTDFVDTSLSSLIPGSATVFVKTWGCAHNNSDGEYMAGLLSEYGYDVVVEESEANAAHVWLLNSCTVKGPAEAHFVNSISEAQSQGKKVIVAGCVPQAWGNSKSGVEASKRANADQLSIIGVQQIDRVVEVVEQALAGNAVRLMGTKTVKQEVVESGENGESSKKMVKQKLGGANLALPKIRRNPLIEIVPISTGCLNACTYCKTKHARGHLGSYPIEEIVERIRRVVAEEGILEIWLTSEDTGAYGIDIDTDITKLLWAILEVLPAPVMLRMGMTNPPYIKRHAEEMARIYSHPRIYKYLHMPIQSASDEVLERMKRDYTRKDFEEICDTLLAAQPKLNIATDLIIGFPGETDADFEQTEDLAHKYAFSSLFINQFYPRPGTPAASMKRVNTQIVKDRTRKLSSWFKSYLPYTGREGEIHTILCTEMAPDLTHIAGRTNSYEMVLVELPSDVPVERLMGRTIEIKIISTGKFFLLGEPTPGALDLLDQQVLPKETVLRRLPRSNRSTDGKRQTATSNAASSPSMPYSTSQRMDYHEGDEGEDYDELDLQKEEEAEEEDETIPGDSCGTVGCCGSGCSTIGKKKKTKSKTPCGDDGCGDCGDCGSESNSKLGDSDASSATSTIGPSDKIKFKSSVEEGEMSNTRKILAIFVAILAYLILNPSLVWDWFM